jgi:hypothetical protein
VLVVIETCHERQEMEDAEASIRALETTIMMSSERRTRASSETSNIANFMKQQYSINLIQRRKNWIDLDL